MAGYGYRPARQLVFINSLLVFIAARKWLNRHTLDPDTRLAARLYSPDNETTLLEVWDSHKATAHYPIHQYYEFHHNRIAQFVLSVASFCSSLSIVSNKPYSISQKNELTDPRQKERQQ
jgi:hypothetical protein